jgi:gluconate 2-dehydrogenase gamma chain
MSDELSRRDAITIMGIVPLAAALGVTPDVFERAMHGAQQALQQPAQFKPKFFSAHEWRTVRLLVDMIIPRDERSGSATDAGVPEFMDFTLMDRTGMQPQMRGGLAWLDRESQDRYVGKRFVEITAAQRSSILDEIAWPRRARPEMSHGVAFFNYIRDFTASGFFSSKVGVEDLRYLGNRFRTEWNGCPDEANARLGVSHDLMKTRIPIQRS